MRQIFGVLLTIALVMGFGFRAQAQNRGSVLVMDVYSANIIYKEIGEKTFFRWVDALKEGQPFALAMADFMTYREIMHMEYPLGKSFDFSREARPAGEHKLVVEGRAERFLENKGYKIAFSALGRLPAFSGKISLTIRPEERRVVVLPMVYLGNQAELGTVVLLLYKSTGSEFQVM